MQPPGTARPLARLVLYVQRKNRSSSLIGSAYAALPRHGIWTFGGGEERCHLIICHSACRRSTPRDATYASANCAVMATCCSTSRLATRKSPSSLCSPCPLTKSSAERTP